MTTVEGGMICTNDEDLYHEFLLLRSHGMLRELPDEQVKESQIKLILCLLLCVMDSTSEAQTFMQNLDCYNYQISTQQSNAGMKT